MTTTTDLTPAAIRSDLAVLADILPRLAASMDQLAKRLHGRKALTAADRAEGAASIQAVAGILRRASCVAAISSENI